MKILIVDDNDAIAKTLLDLFTIRDENNEVMIASNGAAALEKFSTFKPDIVLLDIAMPVMDGIETLEKILRADKDANVIMCSAVGSHTRMEQCINLGAKAYIEKPFDGEEVLATINNVLIDNPEKIKAMAAFSRAAAKMGSSINKITEKNTIVVLNDIEIHSVARQHLTHHDAGNIRTGFNISDDDKFKIDIDENSIGFTSEDGQKKNSKIISIINKKDLYTIFLGNESNSQIIDNESSVFQELFNIIHNNIATELDDSLHLDVNLTPARNFNENIDSELNNRSFITTKFEINSDGNKIPLQTYLWF